MWLHNSCLAPLMLKLLRHLKLSMLSFYLYCYIILVLGCIIILYDFFCATKVCYSTTSRFHLRTTLVSLHVTGFLKLLLSGKSVHVSEWCVCVCVCECMVYL